MNIATPTIECALTARGFTLTTWKHQQFVERVFGEVGVSKQYRRGTLHGLLEHDAAENTLSIVAIHNDVRGNGHFLEAIEAFEAIASEQGVTLRVVQFANTRLASWFSRRRGWTCAINHELGHHAIFNPTL